MNKPKILYGPKWNDDYNSILIGSKEQFKDPSLPMYEYIEYTQEIENMINLQNKLEGMNKQLIADLESKDQKLKKAEKVIAMYVRWIDGLISGLK